jgi:DNA-binding MarR family transcriptional regulator
MKTHPIDALNLWNRIILRSMHELSHDLSTRQMAIMLSVYLVPPPHSVRSLSEQLRISKPAICRALDVLSSLDLVRRKKDEEDRRNVLIQRTVAGSVFLRDAADIIAAEVSNLSATAIQPVKRADVA